MGEIKRNLTGSSDEILTGYSNHHDPEELAEYFCGKGANVGRVYSTYRDVWDAKPEEIQQGLLRLIVKELRKCTAKICKTEALDVHREWLKWDREAVEDLIKSHERQRKRLVKMFGELADLGSDLKIAFTIYDFIRFYRSRNKHYHEVLLKTSRQVSRMESVKGPEDVTNLRGIGKAKAKKLLDITKKENDNGQST